MSKIYRLVNDQADEFISIQDDFDGYTLFKAARRQWGSDWQHYRVYDASNQQIQLVVNPDQLEPT